MIETQSLMTAAADAFDKIQSPWTADQVARLNAHQSPDNAFPFRCGNGTRIIATPVGWICSCCGFTQQWSYKFMVSWPVAAQKGGK